MEIAARPAVCSTMFCPTHREVIELILRPMIGAGGELRFDSCYVSVADVYSAPPYDLVAQHAQPASSGTWYFWSPAVGAYADASASASRRTRRSRAVAGTDGKGRWHTEAGRKPVQGTAGGYMSKFSYQEKTSSSGTTKPGGWLMTEYGINGCDTVIAKIYRSPRRPATNEPPPSWTASSSSTSTWSWRSSFSMTDAAVDALDSVEVHSHQQGLPHYPYHAAAAAAGDALDSVEPHSHQQGLPHYPNHAAAAGDSVEPHSHQQGLPHYPYHAAAAGDALDSLEPHSHQQGLPHYPYLANHYLAGQDLVSAAAADAGQGHQGHYLAAICQPTVAMENHVVAAAAASGQVAGHFPMPMDAAALRIWLGHNQTVLGAGYELQAQHLIPEPQPVDAHSGLPNLQLDYLFWNYYDNTYFG